MPVRGKAKAGHEAGVVQTGKKAGVVNVLSVAFFFFQGLRASLLS